jgi:catechol 2,3-dioxygenase-like lactoylglutathione lyase family enzyme
MSKDRRDSMTASANGSAASCTSPRRKLHFALTVADLQRAVELYRILLGADPIVYSIDYARFDVDDPPIVLSLVPGAAASSGGLNHVGFRVADSEALLAVQERLEAHGIPTQREEGVACCYSRQTKFWVSDADRNLWEVYTVHEDLDTGGFGGDASCVTPDNRPDSQAYWAIYRGPFAEIRHESGRVYPRGRRVDVDGDTWRELREAPFAEHFVCLAGAEQAAVTEQI